uniref:Histidine kinase N-terminal 7TM region domain-containing protein n=1 Tax=Florenciella sp. virus SA2 TaxID=3240092 RepID=A0AB39JC55_9VIRU
MTDIDTSKITNLFLLVIIIVCMILYLIFSKTDSNKIKNRIIYSVTIFLIIWSSYQITLFFYGKQNIDYTYIVWFFIILLFQFVIP